MIERIAAEGRRGRRLFIGTVNLDLARPVVWNITEIAASGHPHALELIREIMLASASIPGAFPPVYMRALYDLGYRLAKEGYPWSKAPPGTIVAE